MPTLYEILEVAADASQEVIRAAYRSLSAKFHPDKDSSPAARERLQQVLTAYEILGEPKRRAEYDASIGKAKATAPVSGQVVRRTDGSSSFLTLHEHLKRKGSDLADCDLSELDLSRLDFHGFNLRGVRLDGSNLSLCDFRDADMSGCSAQQCNFDNARFSGANLTEANFRGSSMRNTCFFQVGPLIGTTESSPSLQFKEYDSFTKVVDDSDTSRRTRLETTCFAECDLRQAVFVAPPARLQTTTTKQPGMFGDRSVPFYLRQTFNSCALESCDFSKSNLHEIDLHGMSLRGNNFSGSNLFGANFQASNIECLDLSCCNLVNANLHGVEYNDQTKFPLGYRLPEDATDMAADRAQRANQLASQQTEAEAARKFTVRLLSVVILLFVCFVIYTYVNSAAARIEIEQVKPRTQSEQKVGKPLDVMNNSVANPIVRNQIVSATMKPEALIPQSQPRPGSGGSQLAETSHSAERPLLGAEWLQNAYQDAAVQAANAGDFDQAITLAHKSREYSSLPQRLELAKMIREFDRLKREKKVVAER